MEISYWSDIACPFCYIGASRMKRAMEAVGLDPHDLKMKAYQLNPHAPLATDETMLTQFAASHGMTEEQARMQFQHMADMGAEEGLKLDVAGAIPTNTFSAHRLIKWAESRLDKKTHHRLITKLYQLYFEEHASIADTAVLLEAAKGVGLPQEEVTALLEGTDFSTAVQQDILEAQEARVQGAPFFVLNNKYGISGAQPYEYMLAALKQVQAEEGNNKK
ncbi:DsbA family oxidoreductase [Streptococcus marmotae]|uniref:DsbA family oxidoreductase n=1 Tax=Streptococcus marmotae TaxID=1825069 RepID=UPI00082B4EEB|nr:DsbA family oxidoreductase [Streptococcus marmotae]